MKKTFLTREGLKKAEDELDALRTRLRTEIAETIKVAKSFGDLSENSEYDEAKNEQAMVQARIAELEEMLANVELIDSESLTTESIHVGNKVRLQNMDTGTMIDLAIVGSKEVNIREWKISDESPIGKACIGHPVGDTVEADAPTGKTSYKIIQISK